jgi:deoxyribodipyrimidine photo-lyase
MSSAIVWFRRDLRVDDNPALAAAVASGADVTCVATADPTVELADPLPWAKLGFWIEGLTDLRARLEEAGGGLMLVSGVDDIVALAHELEADAVYTHGDWQPDEAARLDDAERRLTAEQRTLRRVSQVSILAPEDVQTQEGSSPRTYSSWLRIATGVLEAGDYAPRTVAPGKAIVPPPRPTDLPTMESIGAREVDRDQRGGETAGLERLRSFRDSHGLARYAERRDVLDDPFASSRLSAYIELGMLSRRRVLAVAEKARSRKFRQELLWRDFMDHSLHEHPDLQVRPIDERYAEIEWPGDDEAFDAWRRGRTGFGLVDAGMRQLVQTGFLPNRVRMVAASCLVKTLHVDWHRGERFFREYLIDGSWAVNGGNWQWVTGCGLDAAPFFRIMNPDLQARKFDPDGTYQDRWAPDRPSAPIVDHLVERKRTLALYQAALG